MLSLNRKVFANLLSLLNAISKFQQLRISSKDFLNFVLVYNDNSPTKGSKGSLGTAGFSMNILYVDDKSPVQRGFFTNSVGELLPALGFLGRLYNFCNFVIIFSLM